MTLRSANRLLLFLFLLFAGLYFSRSLLIPLAIAGLVAMLLRPLSAKMEAKGLSRPLASALCVVGLLAIIAGTIALLSWQIKGLAEDMGNASQLLQKGAGKIQHWLSGSLGISPQKQQEIMKEQQQSGSSGAAQTLIALPVAVLGYLTDFILGTVYIFLFLHLRRHLKRFILKLIKDDEDKRTALRIIEGSAGVAQSYLGGLAAMVACLWVMYGIGYSLVGIKGALFFALLCGLLEIIPYVGNITGTALTVLMTLAQGSGDKVLAVLIVYVVVQGLQSYLLEPLVVGRGVKLNPLFTILVLVLGEAVWGVGGMVMAVPLLGIAKIICDHVPALQPYGYLMGTEENKNDPGRWERFKAWWGRRMSKE